MRYGYSVTVHSNIRNRQHKDQDNVSHLVVLHIACDKSHIPAYGVTVLQIAQDQEFIDHK